MGEGFVEGGLMEGVEMRILKVVGAGVVNIIGVHGRDGVRG